MQLRNGKIVNTTQTNTPPIIGYKKAQDNKLVILEIPSWASHNMDRETVFDKQYAKHRCSEARVKEIIDLNTGKKVRKAVSIHDHRFVYAVGETVKPKNEFCELLNEVCAGGIHFFLDRKAAEKFNNYNYAMNEEIKIRYDNGRIAKQYTFVNGSIHGELRRWYDNGGLQEISFFNHGQLDGISYHFYQNGQPHTMCSFRNGVFHGDYVYWYWDGRVRETGKYENNTPTGVWKLWNVEGGLESETNYDQEDVNVRLCLV